ncbi:MAG: hypothetical protein HY852_00950 [Bradyrhizobium sp.]|uniref:hypothetical protein n=1 Tax=Bradyrhizobium sp. TaxID=376 RepID=UPI0025BDD094|nr:hypothetical protein [Bradyrhizobium sp.]MBI5260368.1 hypothetical protein [Bradyrhizobium sp.]
MLSPARAFAWTTDSIAGEFDELEAKTWNVEALQKSLEEVRRIEESGATVICCHDDQQWQSLRKGNAGYEEDGLASGRD